MIGIKLIAIVVAATMVTCEYPYIFGTSVNTKGIANGFKEKKGIAGSQTTVHALDDVSQSVAYANGTEESNARTDGEGIFTPKLHGANTTADAINTGTGNALADSVSKSFNPYKKYWNKNYEDYMEFLNGLFKKYPHKREEIIKVVLKYANEEKKNYRDHSDEDNMKYAQKKQEYVKKERKQSDSHDSRDSHDEHHKGYPTTIADYNNPKFKAIGQTTFDYQRARGSGHKTSASTNSGTFRWNHATVHQGDAVGNAKHGWATSSSNDYGLGRVNYVNSEQNAGAYGENAQTNSESNYYLANDAVWNNGNAWGRAEDKDSLAFSNINGNSYGYGAVNGDTNAYTDGDLAVSKSKVKGAPYFHK